MSCITIGTSNYGTKHYRIFINTGTAWLQEFHVYAYNEQEAIDTIADYCAEHEMHGLYADYYEIFDCAGYGITVDEYAEMNNLICCGNHGVYMSVARIEEIKTSERN